ncbi:MAG: DUF302 domain-containing protein [Thermomicrobiales bacterium]
MTATYKTKYGIGTDVDMSYDEAVEKVTEALKSEGFGVLTTIDVQKTLKEKIDVDRPKYVILGACNPQFAHQALETEPDIGLLLPCNVVVYEQDGKTRVAAMDPEAALSLAENDQIAPVAREVRERIERVIAQLG